MKYFISQYNIDGILTSDHYPCGIINTGFFAMKVTSYNINLLKMTWNYSYWNNMSKYNTEAFHEQTIMSYHLLNNFDIKKYFFGKEEYFLQYGEIIHHFAGSGNKNNQFNDIFLSEVSPINKKELNKIFNPNYYLHYNLALITEEYNYRNVYEFNINNYNSNDIIYYIYFKGISDAHIKLNNIEIVFGGWNNSRSAVRDKNNDKELDYINGSICDTEYKCKVSLILIDKNKRLYMIKMKSKNNEISFKTIIKDDKILVSLSSYNGIRGMWYYDDNIIKDYENNIPNSNSDLVKFYKSQQIPNFFFQTDKIKPQDYYIDMIKSKLNINYKYEFYNDEDVYNFFIDNPCSEFPDILNIYNKITSKQHKADIFRLYYLYVKGGVYMDTDAMIYKNIDDIIDNKQFISGTIEDRLEIHFIASIPKHIIIYNILNTIKNISQNDLNRDYSLVCKISLDNVKKFEFKDTIQIYKTYFSNLNDNPAFMIDNNGDIINIHYYRYKVIPNIYDKTFIDLSKMIVYKYDNLKRIGRDNDGGYAIALLQNNNYDAFLSGGISNDISFEVDFINYLKDNYSKDNNLNDNIKLPYILSYDYSIDNLPQNYINNEDIWIYVSDNDYIQYGNRYHKPCTSHNKSFGIPLWHNEYTVSDVLNYYAIIDNKNNNDNNNKNNGNNIKIIKGFKNPFTETWNMPNSLELCNYINNSYLNFKKDYFSYENIKETLNNYKDIFMKLDIEGGEYDVFSKMSIDEIKNIKQLVIELHDNRNMTIFDKLRDTHYLVHIHGNNYSSIDIINNIIVPKVYECTFIRKDTVDNELPFNDIYLPKENIDMRNNPNVQDILLHTYPYVTK